MRASSVSEALREGPTNPGRAPFRRAGAEGVALPGTLPEAYDEFGQRAYIRYGNGVETTYEYDPARRWLSHITTEHEGNRTVFQDMSYSFDRVGNILGVTNNGSDRVVEQSYTYDNRYQIESASGTAVQLVGGREYSRNSYSQSRRFSRFSIRTDAADYGRKHSTG